MSELSVAEAPVTPDAVWARWEMWGNKCWVCGGVATATDHVKPIFASGLNVPANLRPICKLCNSRKGHKWNGVEEVSEYTGN